VLAFVPGGPVFSIPPDLALALFVAPVLLDAAYDASPRDLKENWAAVAGLVVVSVVLTTIAVAVVARAMVPSMPWAGAIALGAVVAPPDATAATAVLRQVKIPHRLLTILEGESLLNDATALLIYRLAVGAVVAGAFSIRSVAPAFLLAVAGSLVAGPLLAWLLLAATKNVEDVPTAIILQFVGMFGCGSSPSTSASPGCSRWWSSPWRWRGGRRRAHRRGSACRPTRSGTRWSSS
jgi:CPA1 family monovalent cation:H+ antiporter